MPTIALNVAYRVWSAKGVGGANFEVMEMETKAAVIVIAILISMAIIYREKPICQTGFTPNFVLLDGWSCIPGYKPDKSTAEKK
jgi:hypothetical protein